MAKTGFQRVKFQTLKMKSYTGDGVCMKEVNKHSFSLELRLLHDCPLYLWKMLGVVEEVLNDSWSGNKFDLHIFTF